MRTFFPFVMMGLLGLASAPEDDRDSSTPLTTAPSVDEDRALEDGANRRDKLERTRSKVLDTPDDPAEQLGAGEPSDPDAPGFGAARPSDETGLNELDSELRQMEARDTMPSSEPAARRDGAAERASGPQREDWRMVYHQGMWWYWTRRNTWLTWNGATWVDYATGYAYAAPSRGSAAAGPYSSGYRGLGRSNASGEPAAGGSASAAQGGGRSSGGAPSGLGPGGSLDTRTSNPSGRGSAALGIDPSNPGVRPGGQLNGQTSPRGGLSQQPGLPMDRGADASRATGGQPALGPSGGGPSGGGTVGGSRAGGAAGSAGSGATGGSGTGSGGSGGAGGAGSGGSGGSGS